MTPETRKLFHRAMLDGLVEVGQHVDSKGDYYRWADYAGTDGLRERIRSVGVDYRNTPLPEEETISHFVGTFAENIVTVVGTRIALRDGSELRWRYAGSWGDLIEAVCRD